MRRNANTTYSGTRRAQNKKVAFGDKRPKSASVSRVRFGSKAGYTSPFLSASNSARPSGLSHASGPRNSARISPFLSTAELGKLASRMMKLQVNIQDGDVMVSDGDSAVAITPVKWKNAVN